MKSAKQVLKCASQHLAAGLYSLVLEVDPSSPVVVTGQVAVDAEGNVASESTRTGFITPIPLVRDGLGRNESLENMELSSAFRSCASLQMGYETGSREQARYTLENCFLQLESAVCSSVGLFKMNDCLTDLKHRPQFNVIYAELIPKPRPVRTAIGAQ